MSTLNKHMLPQPLRGLDDFSVRASLQNRRKCERYQTYNCHMFPNGNRCL